ncbi:MAG: hypothetical protein HOG79_14655 [Prolixibacteraceae bacterium]|nr:hypothetical protein [Prolixibacteraceae bacterium]
MKKTEDGALICINGHKEVVEDSEKKNERFNLNFKNRKPAQKIEVVSDENPLAVYNHKCKKCGHNKAELIEISCSYSDEDNTYRMKCGKCKHVERLEGKIK